MWKKKYPVVLPRHYEGGTEKAANVYAFIKELSRRLPEGRITVVGNGSACVVGGHAYVIKKGQRFITNSAIASMEMCIRDRCENRRCGEEVFYGRSGL